MKILFLTDSHIKGINPIYRKGSFLGDMTTKISEVIKLSKELGCEKVLHGGDLFDSPLVSLKLCDTFVDMIEHAGIPWGIVRGNHDEIGHNPNLSGESILDHIFRRSKLIYNLGGRSNGKIYIEGFDYYHGIEKDLKEKGLISSIPYVGDKQIAVVHAFITSKPFNPKVMHVVANEIQTDFQLVLVSHYHAEFGILKVNNPVTGMKTTFVSIGSLARLTVADSDISRMPNVLFIDTDISLIKVIPLQSAKPASEVFDLTNLEKKQQFETRIDNFVNSLESVKVQGLNLRSVIEEIGIRLMEDREVIDEVIKRIGEQESR